MPQSDSEFLNLVLLKYCRIMDHAIKTDGALPSRKSCREVERKMGLVNEDCRGEVEIKYVLLLVVQIVIIVPVSR